MRTLHIAALPFPSPQGTQALLHQMLSALAERGHDTHLLCYGHGARASETAHAYTVHRSRRQSRVRSLRSGPSLDKLRLDATLLRELPTLVRRLEPALIIAHHVEAAAMALACRVPAVFVAHTSLAAELPSYFRPALASLMQRAGATLDTILLGHAQRNLAVSPWLADVLQAQSGRPVSVLALPWPVPLPIESTERASARAELGLSAQHELVLYAGNLDAYQGVECVLPALAQLRRTLPNLRVLIATEAERTKLELALNAQGLSDITSFGSLAGERARRLVHAAADLALVPRHSPGGVPIKLLDALARAVPIVTCQRALSGLALADFCAVTESDKPEAWARAIGAVLGDPSASQVRAQKGRAAMQDAHSADHFVTQLLAASDV